jgi:polysaccharide deacetylase family protein (PEP-CTERM system associated)
LKTHSNPATPSGISHLLTFDLEHWYQGYRFRGSIGYSHLPPRDHVTVEKLLRILAKNKHKATFFATGVFAKEFPSLMKDIVAEGHELASHSYDHKLVGSFENMASFKADLRKALAVIEDISGAKVEGFRAPKFSIPDDAEAFYNTLLEVGLKYDSSLFPKVFSRKSPCHPHTITLDNGASIWEFPATTYSFHTLNIPAAGGLWLRLFPLAFSRLALMQGESSKQPRMVYLHPYDLDPDCPRLGMPNPFRNIPFKFARRYNLGSAFHYIEQLLDEFEFVSVKDWISHGAKSNPEKQRAS